MSVFGIVISLVFVSISPLTEDEFPHQSLIVGTTFVAVCLSGTLAALFPRFCSAISAFGKQRKIDSDGAEARRIILRAHHPSCKNYSQHILSIGKYRFCATCSGLLVGAVIAVIGTAAYFFAGFTLGNPLTMAALGLTGVAVGLLQSGSQRLSTGKTRFLSSTIFVFGTFLTLASIDSATKNIALDLFFVSLSVLWILTKIALSQRDHYMTCSECTLERCE